ncbi:MAG: hypothetical protein VYB35_07360 [Verrucomicrobiota bacterium]|nr:hypothetical protein [Verrucomicrobiota bacterium]
MKKFKLIKYIVASVALSSSAIGLPIEEQLSLVPGTWTRDQMTVNGNVRTWTKVIEKGKSKSHFLETITIVNSTNSDVPANKWQLEFEAVPVAGKFLNFNGIRQRNIVDGKPQKWNKANISYIFQVDHDFYHELWDLASGGFRYRRVDALSSVIDASNLDVLKPLLGKYQGESSDISSKAYGARKASVSVTCTAELGGTGSVMKLTWASKPNGEPNKKAFMEAFAVLSYNPSKGRVVKQYQTSTGVMMNGVLISVNNNKLLWERSGDSPAGKLFELCLFDFSEKDTFKHVILKRTLNGVPQLSEENETIILKKVK